MGIADTTTSTTDSPRQGLETKTKTKTKTPIIRRDTTNKMHQKASQRDQEGKVDARQGQYHSHKAG